MIWNTTFKSWMFWKIWFGVRMQVKLKTLQQLHHGTPYFPYKGFYFCNIPRYLFFKQPTNSIQLLLLRPWDSRTIFQLLPYKSPYFSEHEAVIGYAGIIIFSYSSDFNVGTLTTWFCQFTLLFSENVEWFSKK